MTNRLLILIVLSLIAGTTFGQKKDIRQLAQAVVEKAVPPEFTYFHLVDSSFIFRHSISLFDLQELNGFFRKNPGFDLPELIAENMKAQKLNWAGFKIPKARINAYKKVPHYEDRGVTVLTLNSSIPDTGEREMRRLNKHFDVVLRLDKNWTAAQQNEAIQKERERYANSLKPEDKKYFAFSTPIFSKDRRYAIIEVRTALEGWCQVYKKVGRKWIYQEMFSHRMA